MRKGILFVILGLAFASSLEANVKLSELTKSNMSFKKSYKTSEFEGNKSTHRDNEKRFAKDTYSGATDPYYNSDKRYETNSYYDANKRSSVFGDKYNVPEQNFMNTKSRYYNADKELFMGNKDRNLNRKYSGKADFSKKENIYGKADSIYEDLMDKSMSDINKYHSQTAREDSREAGLSVAPANAAKEDSSILDLLDFSTKNIDNSSVKFTLPRSMANMGGISKADDSGNNVDYRQGQNQAPANANTYPQNNYPQNNQISQDTYNQQRAMQERIAQEQAQQRQAMENAAMRNQSAAKAKEAATNPRQKKTYMVDRPVKEDDAETSIFGVPKQWNSGKVQISVEVKPK